jgi:hypothetical protein
MFLSKQVHLNKEIRPQKIKTVCLVLTWLVDATFSLEKKWNAQKIILIQEMEMFIWNIPVVTEKLMILTPIQKETYTGQDQNWDLTTQHKNTKPQMDYSGIIVIWNLGRSFHWKHFVNPGWKHFEATQSLLY